MADIDIESESESSLSNPLHDDGEDGWEDAEPDNETCTFISLFDDKSFHDVNDLLEYCLQNHGFDFKRTQKLLGVIPAHMLCKN